MLKNLKMIFLILIILILASVIILFSRAKTITLNRQEQTKAAVDLVKLKSDYESNMHTIYKGFSQLVNADTSDLNQINDYKGKTLELRLPPEYKDLHIQMILAINKLENFIKTGKREDKLASQKIINDLNVKYTWLNN